MSKFNRFVCMYVVVHETPLFPIILSLLPLNTKPTIKKRFWNVPLQPFHKIPMFYNLQVLCFKVAFSAVRQYNFIANTMTFPNLSFTMLSDAYGVEWRDDWWSGNTSDVSGFGLMEVLFSLMDSENHDKSQDTRQPGRDLNRAFSQYKSREISLHQLVRWCWNSFLF